MTPEQLDDRRWWPRTPNDVAYKPEGAETRAWHSSMQRYARAHGRVVAFSWHGPGERARFYESAPAPNPSQSEQPFDPSHDADAH